MASDRAVVGSCARRLAAGIALATITGSVCWAQAPVLRPTALIFTCVLNGKKITSDRPIHECNHLEQRVLNSDGSLNRIMPPTLTADERASLEQRQRELEAEEVARKDAIRRDRNLMQRFPTEAAHAKAREKALDDVRISVRNSEARIAQLSAERKPLDDEKEFYVGKPLPTKLKLALDSNDASLEAQKALAQNQQTELRRINDLYDAELLRLRKLWAGAPAGSLGPLPGAPGEPKGGSKAAAARPTTALQVPEATRVKSP
jgi:hypothetical protein